jgi:hypothetical protein
MTGKKIRLTPNDLIIYEPGKIDVRLPEFSDIASGEQVSKLLISELDTLKVDDPLEAENTLRPYWREALEKSILFCKIRLGGLCRLERTLVEEIERADREIAWLEVAIKQIKNKRRASLFRLREIR